MSTFRIKRSFISQVGELLIKYKIIHLPQFSRSNKILHFKRILLWDFFYFPTIVKFDVKDISIFVSLFQEYLWCIIFLQNTSSLATYFSELKERKDFLIIHQNRIFNSFCCFLKKSLKVNSDEEKKKPNFHGKFNFAELKHEIHFRAKHFCHDLFSI